jgi:hypothetical protein
VPEEPYTCGTHEDNRHDEGHRRSATVQFVDLYARYLNVIAKNDNEKEHKSDYSENYEDDSGRRSRSEAHWHRGSPSARRLVLLHTIRGAGSERA